MAQLGSATSGFSATRSSSGHTVVAATPKVIDEL